MVTAELAPRARPAVAGVVRFTNSVDALTPNPASWGGLGGLQRRRLRGGCIAVPRPQPHALACRVASAEHSHSPVASPPRRSDRVGNIWRKDGG